MQQHYIQFLSPGTFVAEATSIPIDEWDIDRAVALSGEINERHGSRPYGFQFVTRARSNDELDAKEVARSATHYLGGKIDTVEDVRNRALPDERILLANMESNGWDRIVVNSRKTMSSYQRRIG